MTGVEPHTARAAVAAGRHIGLPQLFSARFVERHDASRKAQQG